MNSLLLDLLSIDNGRRAKAEIDFNHYKLYQTKDFLLSLIDVILHGDVLQVKVLGCIVLRGLTLKEASILTCLDLENFRHISNELVIKMINDENQYFQRKLCDALVLLIKEFEWKSLLDISIQLSRSSSSKDVKLCLYLIDKLCEYSNISKDPSMSSYFAQSLFPIIESNLISNDSVIQSLAINALISLLYDCEMPTNLDFYSLLAKLIQIIIVSPQTDTASEIIVGLLKLQSEKPIFFINVWHFLYDELISHMSNNLQLSFCDTLKSNIIELLISLITNFKLRSLENNPQLYVDRWKRLLHLSVGFLEPSLSFCDTAVDSECTLSDNAKSCIEELSHSIDSVIFVQECLSISNSLIMSNVNLSQHRALILIGCICDGVKSKLYPFLHEIVPTILNMVMFPDLKLQFSALLCLETLIEEYNTLDSNEHDNSDINELEFTMKRQLTKLESFHHLFPDVIPSMFAQYLQVIPMSNLFTDCNANNIYVHLYKLSLKCLRLYFNPDVCRKKACRPYINSLIDFCMNIMSNIQIDVSIRQEAISLLANMSALSPENLINSKYMDIMSSLKSILMSNSENSFGVTSPMRTISKIMLESRLLKGKCLECYAILGKAVGVDLFINDAIDVMTNLIIPTLCNQKDQEIEYSDPFISYVTQSCARIATVIGDEFRPFINLVLPSLLSQLKIPLAIDITDENELSFPNHDIDSIKNGFTQDNQYSIYQRGLGRIEIKYSTHEINEKETALRVLYQYCLDIPNHLISFVPEIVISVVHLLLSPTASDDIYMITCALLSECFRFYLRLSLLSIRSRLNIFIGSSRNESSSIQKSDEVSSILTILGQIIATVIVHINKAWEKCQTSQNRYNEPIESVYILIDGLREFLKVVYDEVSNVDITAECAVSWFREDLLNSDVIKDTLQLIRDEISVWVKRRFVDNIKQIHEQSIKLEEDTINALQDCCNWLIKLVNVRLTEIPFFRQEFIPFLQSILISRPDNQGLEDYDTLIQLPMSILLEIVESHPEYSNMDDSNSLCSYLEPLLLLHYDYNETIVPCFLGFGILAQHNSRMNDPHRFFSIIFLLLNTIGWYESLGLCVPYNASIDSYKSMKTELDDDEQLILKENIVASLFKLVIFQNQNLNAVLKSSNSQVNNDGVNALLSSIINELPLLNSLYDARIFHDLFINIAVYSTNNSYACLYGPNYQNAARLIQTLVKLLISVNLDELMGDDSMSIADVVVADTYAEQDIFDHIKFKYEFWDNQIISYTGYTKIYKFLKSLLVPNQQSIIPMEVLFRLQQELPIDIQEIIKSL